MPPDTDWQPIETAPKPAQWLREPPFARVLLAKFWQPVDEDGAEVDAVQMAWSAVAYLSHDGWMLPTDSIAGMHGYGSFRLRDDATHWMRVPQIEQVQ